MKKENEKRQPEIDLVSRKLTTPPRPLWKSVLFTIIIVAAFFVGLELSLALIGVDPVLLAEDPFVGFAKNIPLFAEERRPDGSVLLKTAPNKWNWFNKDQAFPKTKGPNSYRVFCMGESTTYGHPYDDRVSFCGWLRAYLKAADPTRDWEVINAGGVSYASYRIAKLMEELKRYEPDLFIFYVGQNEFLERRSYGRLMKLPRGTIKAGALLSRTRTWAAIERAIEIVRPDPLEEAKERYELSGEVDDILKHTLGPTSYHRDDTLKGQIIQHYRLSLGRMIDLARSGGAEVIFVQPAINLKDMSPFKSEHKEGLSEKSLGEWEDLYRLAGALHKEGRQAEALGLYRQALEIDDRYAELHYRIGEILFELGKYGEAEKAFWRAVDEDIAPLRILSPMQRVVEEVAADYRVPLIDFPKLLREAYKKEYDHAVFGKEYFVDHVHTNIEGYRLLGLALTHQLIKQEIVTPHPTWAAEIESVGKEVMSGLDRQAEGMALKTLGKTFDWAGKYDEAHDVFLRALEALGPDAEIYRRLGTSAVVKREYDDAIFYFNEVARLEPELAGVRHQLARLSVAKGNAEEAIGHFREELRRDPENPVVHTELAVVLAKKGENGEARRHLDAAVKLAPDFEPAHLNLAILAEREERDDEVWWHSREVIRLNPNQHLGHLYLGVVLKKQGKTKEAIHYLSEAVRLKPDNPAAKKHLQEALAERTQ